MDRDQRTRGPNSDRIPSRLPHQVSTNTRSANTKLIKFVLNLRYDTFILAQGDIAGEIGVNFESSEQQMQGPAGRVLPFYILLCNNCICDLGEGWHRQLTRQVLEGWESLEKPISRAQPARADVSNYLSCQQVPSPLSLYLSLHPLLSRDYLEPSSSHFLVRFSQSQINGCIVRR